LPKTASAEEIRSAVPSLLQDPSYRRAAAAAGARLRSRNGAIAAADELEGLLNARKDSAPVGGLMRARFACPSG
jgi:UDP:flavonoid glycosyltransferase YjiC (YdhE family)